VRSSSYSRPSFPFRSSTRVGDDDGRASFPGPDGGRTVDDCHVRSVCAEGSGERHFTQARDWA
jgi:hypothetical protein